MPADNDSYWLSMPGATKGTFGLVHVTDSGDIEVELCERVSTTSDATARQRSTIYTVASPHVAMLAQQLARGFGGPVAGLSQLPDQLTTFLNVQCLIEWLTRQSGIECSKRVVTVS